MTIPIEHLLYVSTLVFRVVVTISASSPKSLCLQVRGGVNLVNRPVSHGFLADRESEIEDFSYFSTFQFL